MVDLEPPLADVANLTVSGLGVMRAGRVLFRQLGFQLSAGQALMLRGANGSGKSSLLRTLAGLAPWQAGQLRWRGQAVDSRAPAYLGELAYLGHTNGLSDGLSLHANLDFGLALHGTTRDARSRSEVLDRLNLRALGDRLVGRLSQGQRRRVGLARLMLSGRRLWLLDEPESSLDAAGLKLLEQVLLEHLARGGLAVLASHGELCLPERHLSVLNLGVQRTQELDC